jgi:hypothetical protein
MLGKKYGLFVILSTIERLHVTSQTRKGVWPRKMCGINGYGKSLKSATSVVAILCKVRQRFTTLLVGSYWQRQDYENNHSPTSP